ncbi:Fhl1p [Lachancea thermotolerans CBS 6340]|uniref:KLTH0D03036p n=1 Tax=Lachancea thermotolerans (strain ATCC 56472 / CBS 6340 / NRRL Y-8284) TaxID=559295 RepID=C5DG78_LACTC|nr:KLTH0D03036p [Lachancea thermotolerans CBS 6340]CAR22420.1 KLTH0D03036p [Lachancea thermotolerans CBS 6340]
METSVDALTPSGPAAEDPAEERHNSDEHRSPKDEPENFGEPFAKKPSRSNSQVAADEAAAEAKRLIDDPNLKLEIPDSLDHEHFSKLLELDSKNDDDLFSSTDLLEHEIAEHPEKLANDIAETVPTDDATQHLHSLENLESLGKLSEEAGGDVHSNPGTESPSKIKNENQSPSVLVDPVLADDRAIHPDIYNSDPLSTGAGTREDTPASILEDKHELLDDQKQDASTKLGYVSLQPPLPENAVNKIEITQPIEPNSELPMTEFHDGANSETEQSKISAYARLDFQSFTFYVQTLQVIIGRRSENDFSHKVDVNLGPSKSISRRHAQIFYNFGTGRFELSIMGKNGAFVDDTFVERGITVQLKNKAKVQIGQIPFQFVLPDQEGKEKKAIEPVDAISLKTALNNNNKLAEISRSVTPIPIPSGESTELKDEELKDQPAKKKTPPKKKEKKEPKAPKPPKKIYTLEEIPPEYRTKPTGSYSNLITACLRKFSSPKGMSLSGIYAGIRELFPYYKYCPDGWQSSVRHNLSLNKSFRKVSKEGKGWLWGLNEEYIAEREKQKKKQAEAAAEKAKAAQLKLEQQQQQKAKKAAESGSMIKSVASIPARPKVKQPNISQTLAANRADRKATADANQRTMKYLQEQLMILTKDRKGLDKHVMASILTQALAMTINQVTQAAKSKGITGNPLTALIDKNPQHLNLILAAAVNAATVKVTNGSVKQLVSMPPPTVTAPQERRAASPSTSNIQPTSGGTSNLVASANPGPAATVKSSESFDPTSLSKFFQPKQPSRVPTPSPARSVLPLKRASSETESSSDDESTSGDESGSADSDASDGSDSDDDSSSSSGGSSKGSSSDEGSSDGE